MPRHGVPRGTRCRAVRGAAYTGFSITSLVIRDLFLIYHMYAYDQVDLIAFIGIRFSELLAFEVGLFSWFSSIQIIT